MTKPELSESQAKNRTSWSASADWWASPGASNWARAEPVWGIWELPESELRLLPDDLTGHRCLEIGCGTAYVGAWMAARGGSVTGIDPTRKQLETAIQLREKYQQEVHLVEAFGESLPFPDDTFDFAISEYGASLWADPYVWVPEAARVLKRGAQLVLLTNHVLNVLTLAESDEEGQTTTLQRPYFGLHSIAWEDEDSVEYYLTHGDWIRLFGENGFEIERLLELGAPNNAKSKYVDWANSEWGQHWPTEEVWLVRKRVGS